jgi:hypothetical protein
MKKFKSLLDKATKEENELINKIEALKADKKTAVEASDIQKVSLLNAEIEITENDLRKLKENNALALDKAAVKEYETLKAEEPGYLELLHKNLQDKKDLIKNYEQAIKDNKKELNALHNDRGYYINDVLNEIKDFILDEDLKAKVKTRSERINYIL